MALRLWPSIDIICTALIVGQEFGQESARGYWANCVLLVVPRPADEF